MQEFTISVEGQEMRVRYEPNWARFASYAHIEFLSTQEPRRRIPVSATGYRSHFSPMADVESFATVEEYAHELALAIMRDKGPVDDEDEAQGSLF
jgi:hypothetical protein